MIRHRLCINGAERMHGFELGDMQHQAVRHVVRVGQLDQLQHEVRRRHQESPLEGVVSTGTLEVARDTLTSRDAAANRFVVKSIVLYKNNLTTKIIFIIKNNIILFMQNYNLKLF